MAKVRKKQKKSRGRLIPFVLFLIASGLVFLGRHELLWGVKGYFLDEIDFDRIESQSDLPPSAEARARPAEVEGIPDYKNAHRFQNEGRALTCYRMVNFGNRLCVCTEKGLAKPKAIDEIIRVRTVRGRLESLTKSRMNDSLRRIFLETGSIHLAKDAFLLSEDPRPLPSKVKVGLLSFCVILCCLSAYGLIKQ